jgi:hypothetical protein
VPESADQTLFFIIPFEQGKSEYKPEDIAPFIEELNKPDFLVNQIHIVAHSSFEGDSTLNAKLQRERAESIVRGIEQFQKMSVQYTITTDDSYDLFRDSLKKTAYSSMANMSRAELRQTLTPDFIREHEAMFQSQRFARIELKVTYDISGSNEEKFVLQDYQKAISEKNAASALAIQQYMMQQVKRGRFSPGSITQTALPQDVSFASLHINKRFIEVKYERDELFAPTDKTHLDDLYRMYPKNDFAAFNKYMASIILKEIPEKNQRKEFLTQLQSLHTRKNIPTEMVDGLNLEYQLQLIEAFDTLEPNQPNEEVDKAMEQVKKMMNLEAGTWQNNLSLAYIFMKHGDLEFAQKLLEPYVSEPDVNEQLLFTYISVAANNRDQIFSRNFRQAMQKASELNREKYCDLFGAPFLSFQMMDNPLIKEQYCRSCQQ